MHFLFINPNRTIAKSNIWSVINSVTPPLGLANLSAVLDKEGHTTEIIDAYALNLSISEVLSCIKPHTEIVGITATTPEIDEAVRIARSVRSRYPSVKIAMGGVHPTVFHEELVNEGICDIAIRGEGENIVLKIAGGCDYENIPNITWRASNGEVVVNQQVDDYADLEQLPMPSYHKLPIGKYRSAIGAAKKSPSIGIITSRGCPGKCTFCFSGMFGSNMRFMSAGKVFEHISHLKSNYGIKEISFYDDTFTANRKRVEELCKMMISAKAGISWSCFARVDTVNPDILKLMKEAGCHQVMYGFESVDENILRAINKRVNSSKYLDIVSWMKEAGIDIRGAFMLGSPQETEESLKSTIEYSKKIGIQYAIYNITTPFPGTALFGWAMENGLIKHTDWKSYDLSNAVMELPTVPSHVVQRYYHEAYRQFYLRASYIFDRLLSIRSRDELSIYWKAFKGILSLLLFYKIHRKDK